MTPALILDIVLLAILLFTAYTYMKSGFLSAITRLVGNLASLFGAMVVANKLSPVVFENFFKSGLISKTAENLATQGKTFIEPIIAKLSAILPTEIVQDLQATAEQLLVQDSPDMAKQLVERIISPLVVPIISVVVFFATFAICRFIVAQVAAMLKNVNRVPILGGVNRILGLVTGAAGGVVEIVLVLCAIWAVVAITGGSIEFLNDSVLSQSKFYALFSVYNPFI